MSGVAKLYSFFSSQVNESYEIWKNCAQIPDSFTSAYGIFKIFTHAPIFSSGSKISRVIIPLTDLLGYSNKPMRMIKNVVCLINGFASWDKKARTGNRKLFGLANLAKITKIGRYLPNKKLVRVSFIASSILNIVIIIKDRKFISLRTLKVATNIFYYHYSQAAARQLKISRGSSYPEHHCKQSDKHQKQAAFISLLSGTIGLIKLGHQINNWQPAG